MGPDVVSHLEGSPRAKTRLKAILETIAGKKTVEEVCGELGISESMFFKLRDRTMTDALESLEPRPMGRPVERPQESGEEAKLREENGRLRMELEAARIREELAVLMPHVLKKKRESGTVGKPGPSRDGKPGT
jgi:transposase-like protein